ncbi:VOC family protein [Kutzneria viridogrisea]|uniref:VOC domain-containing protein n=2 Tax=Kutzneria TaxID=43356 RepID=W5WJW2_9PSEU|nr:VOC family protein [Kutzneria albida]AHI00872.1 hypothetical protein KALB_7514 [Kutzneria albida DSM 43870]MBA8926149.1 catechol 2,3-dioxygenase-like lactoylglutathione lyase family enzyme [Kutzneria viridogrisea]
MTAPRFSAIGLVVADMAKSLAFYRALGLDIPAGADSEPHVEVTLPGGLRLMWDSVQTVHSFNPSWQAPVGSSRAALAFDCGSPQGVDEAFANLVGAGYEGGKQPWDAFWGQRYATLHDPDGNEVDLFAAA